MNFEYRAGRFSCYFSLNWMKRKKHVRMMGQNAGEDEMMESPATRQPFEPEHLSNAVLIQERAEKLLLEGLDVGQRAQLDRENCFEVVGNLGHRYRIHRGRTRNVYQLDQDGTVIRALCAAPLDVPEADAMLAQKLLIEHDELAYAFVARTSLPSEPGVGQVEAQEIGPSTAAIIHRDFR